jgi:hypothetical protein
MKITMNLEGHISNCDLFKGYNPTALSEGAEKTIKLFWIIGTLAMVLI